METELNTFTESAAAGNTKPNVSAAPGKVTVIFYFQSEVNLNPVAAVVGSGFVLNGTTSCQQLKDILSDQGNETEIFVRQANENITGVSVSLGNTAPVAATPTGPAGTPWTSWTLAVSGVPDGQLTIVAKAFPSKIPATASRSTVVDLTPPTITINPPADVVVPAPPFIAAISGTAADTASGVAAVDWQFGSGAINTAAGTTSWLAQVPLPGLGVHTVAFRARDNIGNAGPMQTVTVRVGDITAPALGIAVPAEGETRPLVDGKATFDLRGTASDTQSGVALVEWSLDGQTTFTPATPQPGNDWSTWSAQVPVTVAGNHTITVRATDKATPGNPTTLQRGVVVAEPFQPKDPDAVFSPAAYLDDMLDFAIHRARTTAGGALISRQLLVDTYLQPFTDLVTSGNRSVANQSVSQVRLCIDVLRRYLAAHGGAIPADTEAAYRQAAYVAVLRQLGTSFDEMRLARVADDASRTALANRLGIALARFRPDRLDGLLFQPAVLTEAALKVFFGLEETTIKPLTGSLLPEPNLLIWQKEHLRAGWQQQDDDARSELDTPAPVIDPDMLGTQDLRTPSPGNAAFDLWKARKDDLAAHLTALDAARKSQKTQQAGFDKIAAALGPVADLLAMAEDRKGGKGIDAQLRAKRLTIQAFQHLMRVRRLAAAGTVLDSEWADVYAILVQVRKLGRAAGWRGEEQKKGLIIGPDFFRLPDPVAAPTPALPVWRATPQARQAWRRTLESRIQQELTLTQAMQSAVSAAEEEALPLLRQACLAAIAGDRDPAVIADRLTQELGIDCLDSGRQRTTRAQQGLETLQVVLLSLRTGRLKTEPPVLGTVNPAAAWVLALDLAKPYTENDFDEEWLWMGGYGTWNAAIRVFAYPEIYLLPELRPVTVPPVPPAPPAPPRPIDQTNAYQQLMTDLRNQPRLTPVQARALALRYHQTLNSDLGDVLPASLRPGVLTITEQVTDSQLAVRRTFIRDTLFARITDPSKAPNYVQEIFFFVPLALALQLQRSGQYLVALDWIETFYTDHLAVGERKIYYGLVLEEKITTQYQRNPDNWLRVGLNPHEIVNVRASAYTRFTLITLARCYLDFADAEFTRDDGEAVARARTLYGTALALLGLPEMQPPGSGSGATPFPPNPVPQALKMRGQLNLFKLRSGRNIAGIERQAAVVSQPALTLDRLPVAGGAQRLFRPTPYRYAVLVERAKNLVSIAQQVEQAFLAALEKRDAEVYNLLKAGHDLQLTGATVDLHSLQVREAEEGIGLAERQLDRAATQRDTYQGWIDAGLNTWEITTLASHIAAGVAEVAIVEAQAVLDAAAAATAAASGGFLGTGLSGGIAASAAVAVAAVVREGAQLLHIAAQTTAQVSAAKASFERRSQEWELQRQLAEGEMAIGAQQVTLAQTHTDVARQEVFISSTQHDQAQTTVEFLANKFTSAELYSWMSGILGGSYNYFLQQATAMAQLAQYQLAFERQESPPSFIKADYWEATDDQAQRTSSQNTPDRQGLTGSVRLLQDITRLDQFAFDTNRRKLQLSQTISLARLAPVEFQRFRETGVLPFATPMTLFDQGFPGHYMRLLKRAHVSVVALVPATHGLRATLIASGISRVVTGGEVFTTITVRRDPELITFTGTNNATGLLELEPDAGMLLPFEGMGVDTNWELQLPKAANPFDYRTISDVLFTVEYTALQDFSYRQQVIQQLDDRVSADRVISVRDQFADQWYALHNPVSTDAPMTVEFTLTSDGFPPNLDDLRIQQVLFAVVRAPGATFEIGQTQLTLTPGGETAAVGGAVVGTVDGLVSTRRGNASAWVPLIGRSPAGGWQLTLPDTEEMRSRFHNDEVDDLLLILTYEGRTPAWPV